MKLLTTFLITIITFSTLAKSPVGANTFPYSKARDVLTVDEFEYLYKLTILNDIENSNLDQKIYYILPSIIEKIDSHKIVFDTPKIKLIASIDLKTKELINNLYEVKLDELSQIPLRFYSVDTLDLGVEEEMLVYRWKSDVSRLMERLGFTFSVNDKYSDIIKKIQLIKNQTQAVILYEVEKKHGLKILAIIKKINSIEGINLIPYLENFETHVWNKDVLSSIDDDLSQVQFYTQFENTFINKGHVQLGINYSGIQFLNKQDELGLKKLILPIVYKHDIESSIYSKMTLNCKISQSYIDKLETSVYRTPSGKIDLSVIPGTIGDSEFLGVRACKIENNQIDASMAQMASLVEDDFKSSFTQLQHVSQSFKNKVIKRLKDTQGEYSKLPVHVLSEAVKVPVSYKHCWNERKSRRCCKTKVFGVCVDHGRCHYNHHKCQVRTRYEDRVNKYPQMTKYASIVDVKSKLGLKKTYRLEGESKFRFSISDESLLDITGVNFE